MRVDERNVQTVDGLADIEASLDPSAWTFTPRDARVLLPRFTTGLQLELTPVLQALGVRAAFANGADLSGIATVEELDVTAVLHQARIDVHEEVPRLPRRRRSWGGGRAAGRRSARSSASIVRSCS